MLVIQLTTMIINRPDCRGCHDELRSTTFYEPPHDITHHQAGP